MESSQLKQAMTHKHNAAYYFAVGYNAAQGKEAINAETFAYAYREDYKQRVNGDTQIFPNVRDFAEVYLDSLASTFYNKPKD